MIFHGFVNFYVQKFALVLFAICGFLGSNFRNFDWIFMFETISSVLKSSTLCWLFSVGLSDSFVPSFSLLLWARGDWVLHRLHNLESPSLWPLLGSHQWRPLAGCQTKKNNEFRWWSPLELCFHVVLKEAASLCSFWQVTKFTWDLVLKIFSSCYWSLNGLKCPMKQLTSIYNTINSYFIKAFGNTCWVCCDLRESWLM